VEKDTIYVALDDSKRKLVIAILQPGAAEPEEREIPKDAQHIQGQFQRLQREGPVQACYSPSPSLWRLARCFGDRRKGHPPGLLTSFLPPRTAPAVTGSLALGWVIRLACPRPSH